MNSEIYLDVNATSPVLPAAIAAAALAMREGFGNQHIFFLSNN